MRGVWRRAVGPLRLRAVLSARYGLCCNACKVHAPSTSGKGIAQARRINRAQGWTNPRPGVDWCGPCSRKAAEARAAFNKKYGGDYL